MIGTGDAGCRICGSGELAADQRKIAPETNARSPTAAQSDGASSNMRLNSDIIGMPFVPDRGKLHGNGEHCRGLLSRFRQFSVFFDRIPLLEVSARRHVSERGCSIQFYSLDSRTSTNSSKPMLL